ncbi:MAG TPA: lysophospholipid acyltransferase family protein, partial [Candidatus Aquicultoraceae bacterium]|nr:lysophospholipid acyltransferase family protein [Candidatus Aquicultoraceae bacterium]
AFPEMDDRETSRIIRTCYVRMGTSAAEFIELPRIDRAYIDRRVRIEGIEHLRATESERGLGPLVLTGHFGNWELASHAFALVVAPMAFIVRPLKNRHLDRIVTERRECVGNRAIAKYDSAKEVMRAVRSGTTVGILIDQNVDRHKGVLVDFFSKKAYTSYGIARMALSLRTNIHPAFFFRDKRDKFRHTLRFGPAVAMDLSVPREEEVIRLTRRCNEELEKVIREDPVQWLWFHRRWKTRPPGEADPYREGR